MTCGGHTREVDRSCLIDRFRPPRLATLEPRRFLALAAELIAMALLSLSLADMASGAGCALEGTARRPAELSAPWRTPLASAPVRTGCGRLDTLQRMLASCVLSFMLLGSCGPLVPRNLPHCHSVRRPLVLAGPAAQPSLRCVVSMCLLQALRLTVAYDMIRPGCAGSGLWL